MTRATAAPGVTAPPGPARPAVAVVAVRGGTTGKSRLARALDADDRSALVVALARHVVGTLGACADVREVLVVTGDPAWARRVLADAGGPVRVVPQPADRPGLDAAVDVGREVVRGAGSPCGEAPRLLVVHADLPALTPDDVGALLGSTAPLTLATDRLGTGTNALVLGSTLAPFTFRFGAASLAAHRAEAVRRGLRPLVLRRPGTQLDLDTPDDWAALPRAVRDRLVAAVPALTRLDGA